MGVTVRERDGAWWVFIAHQGKRKAKRIGPGKQGKQAAQAVAAKIAAKLTLGDVGVLEPKAQAKAVPTFEAVANEWERVAAPGWKQGTKITYGNALRCRLLPTFGPLPMNQVTPERVEAWWTAAREEGVSKKRLGTLRGVLRGVCHRAVRLGLLPVNPADCIDGRLGREDRELRRGDFLTAEDLTKLLATAERVCPKEYPLFLVMATCGLRLGEATGLQVGDLDGAGQQLYIRRTVSRGHIGSPKNGKGRAVDVPETTMHVLATLQEIRQVEAVVAGTAARWLFPGRHADMPLSAAGARGVFRRALRAAGIRKVRPHDLRHTYATLAIKAGVPLLTVSRQLGHASISTTADLYAHAVPGENRAAAEAMEAILTRNHTQPPRNLTS